MSNRTPITEQPWSLLVGGLREYAVFTLDEHGVIDSWNEGVRELFGFEEHEFVGKPGSVIFTLEDRVAGADDKEFSVARAQGEAMDDRWHVRKNGSRFWANGIMRAVKSPDGEVIGYLKILRDQTEKRLTEARLRESDRRFTTAFRNSPSPMALLKAHDLRVLDVNDAFIKTFGQGRPDVIGRTLQQIGLAPEPDGFSGLAGALERDRRLTTEAPFTGADGLPGFGTFTFEPITLAGEPHAIMLMHDVTQWRRVQSQLEQQQRLVEAILNSLPGVFYMMDDEHLVRWNDELERVTGLTGDELTKATAADIVVEAEEVREHIAAAFANGASSMEGRLRSVHGVSTPYLLTGRLVHLDGAPFVLGVGVEISDQVNARSLLERRATEQTVFAELAASTLATRDVQPTLDLATRRVARTLGADHARIVEATDEGLQVRASFPVAAAAQDDGAPPPRKRDFDLELIGAESLPAEALEPLGMSSGVRFRIHSHGGTFGFLEVFSTVADAFNVDDQAFLGGVTYLLAAAIEQQRLHQELEVRAETDDLTGLLKRVAFEHRLVAALGQAERNKTKVAVLFMDLDLFKEVNDSLGHHAGDLVLSQVAGRVREAVRSWDVVARHGGDEFVLFLPDIKERTEIEHVTARLLTALSEPYEVDAAQVLVGATIGVAVYPDDGTTVKELLKAADSALYRGKAKDRAAVHFESEEPSS